MTNVIARSFSRLHMDVRAGRQAAGTLTCELAWPDSLRSISAVLLLLLSASLPAQEPSRATRKEVTHLFEHLGQSGCEFYRNGSWHDSKKAAAHLRKKYVYLLAKELVPTTEAFIDRAATKSSLSGKPYRVRCANQAEIQSRIWFTAELERWRKPSH